jgi:hypothetical protein
MSGPRPTPGCLSRACQTRVRHPASRPRQTRPVRRIHSRLRHRPHACCEHNGRRQAVPPEPRGTEYRGHSCQGGWWRIRPQPRGACSLFLAYSMHGCDIGCAKVRATRPRPARNREPRRAATPPARRPGHAATTATPAPTAPGAPEPRRTPDWERSRARAIIRTREGPGRLERARTPGPDPAGGPSAASEGIRPS